MKFVSDRMEGNMGGRGGKKKLDPLKKFGRYFPNFFIKLLYEA